jgi:hypothetical protein
LTTPDRADTLKAFQPGDAMKSVPSRFFLILLCFALSFGVSCFTADTEPPDDDSFPADDDASGDDAADDAADDDTHGDDAADDVADDDFGDDDTSAVSVDCEGIVDFVYEPPADDSADDTEQGEHCGDTFENKENAGRLTRDEALDACESDGVFWECVQGCLDSVMDQADGHCSGMLECVEAQCTQGEWRLVDL